MPVSDEAVQSRQDQISALRAERDAAKIEAETVFKQYGNDITMAVLDVEEERLKAELAQFQSQSDSAKVKASVDAEIEAITGLPEVAPVESAKATGKTAKE